VVTRDAVKAHPLPERHELEAAARMYARMVEGGDPGEAAAAARLYRELVAPALRLPLAAKRLIVVADGALHLVPFAALRDPGEGPLAARFDLTMAPSASLWRRWRARAWAAGSRSHEVMVVADPEPPGEPGRLPHAREEALRVAEIVDAEVRAGAAATLPAGAAAAGFAMLHFAVHGVVDEERPERSALLLADGPLQIREIVNLALDGQVVVLSACGSAAGAVLRVEGVLGLHRAFLQAGARAVLGSLWSVRDDDSERLVTSLYDHLARGERLDAALAAAQRERMRAGAPPASWAWLVATGDGAARPLGARDRTRAWVVFWSVAAVVLLAAAALARRGPPH
jgi:CHAT domain-containing protein